MQPTPEQISKYGTPGSPIGGRSTLVRDYCRVCAEPIRVTDATMTNRCVDCRGIREIRTGKPPTRTQIGGAGIGCWTNKRD